MAAEGREQSLPVTPGPTPAHLGVSGFFQWRHVRGRLVDARPPIAARAATNVVPGLPENGVHHRPTPRGSRWVGACEVTVDRFVLVWQVLLAASDPVLALMFETNGGGRRRAPCAGARRLVLVCVSFKEDHACSGSFAHERASGSIRDGSRGPPRRSSPASQWRRHSRGPVTRVRLTGRSCTSVSPKRTRICPLRCGELLGGVHTPAPAAGRGRQRQSSTSVPLCPGRGTFPTPGGRRRSGQKNTARLRGAMRANFRV